MRRYSADLPPQRTMHAARSHAEARVVRRDVFVVQAAQAAYASSRPASQCYAPRAAKRVAFCYAPAGRGAVQRACATQVYGVASGTPEKVTRTRTPERAMRGARMLLRHGSGTAAASACRAAATMQEPRQIGRRDYFIRSDIDTIEISYHASYFSAGNGLSNVSWPHSQSRFFSSDIPGAAIFFQPLSGFSQLSSLSPATVR